MGWLFYTLLLVCCFNVKANETPTCAELNETTSTLSPKNCQDVYKNGGQVSGVYSIFPNGTEEVQVFCEQKLQEGGWTIFQRRMDGRVNFTRTWAEYKAGFGSIKGEYWLGNDIIHLMTVNKDQRLMVEMEYRGLTAYAEYSVFWIKDEIGKYQLTIGGFSNGLNKPGDSLGYSNGKYFSTWDRDHDEFVGTYNCAASWMSAWWYYDCARCDLNGPYGSVYYRWYEWTKDDLPLTASRMMLKPK